MKIEFVEDIDVALRKSLVGRVTKRRRFKPGETCCAEFLGEDSDLETVDLQFEDGLYATKVPRTAVSLSQAKGRSVIVSRKSLRCRRVNE